MNDILLYRIVFIPAIIKPRSVEVYVNDLEDRHNPFLLARDLCRRGPDITVNPRNLSIVVPGDGDTFVMRWDREEKQILIKITRLEYIDDPVPSLSLGELQSAPAWRHIEYVAVNQPQEPVPAEVNQVYARDVQMQWRAIPNPEPVPAPEPAWGAEEDLQIEDDEE